MGKTIKTFLTKYLPILIFICLLIFGYSVYDKIWKKKENFNDNKSKLQKKFEIYNKYFYPLSSKLSEDENNFIDKWIKKLEKDDIYNDKHISAFTFGITLHKNGHINKSRYGIGTKTKFDEFKNDVIRLLKLYKVTKFLPSDYNYYGVAWDIEDKLIKVYGLNKDNSTIICNVYTIKRNNYKIKSIEYDSEKTYDVGSDKTIMKKDGKHIKQYNTLIGNYPIHFMSKYQDFDEIIEFTKKHNFHLDTYSEYDGKLNLYFD